MFANFQLKLFKCRLLFQIECNDLLSHESFIIPDRRILPFVYFTENTGRSRVSAVGRPVPSLSKTSFKVPKQRNHDNESLDDMPNGMEFGPGHHGNRGRDSGDGGIWE